MYNNCHNTFTVEYLQPYKEETVEDFVNFSIAKKLKEKGFTCNYPFAMYNELGNFHPLYTSCEETLVNCMFGNRGYYNYDDFDDTDCIAPTISQVLKWLREERYVLIGLSPMQEYGGEETVEWHYTVYKSSKQGGLSRKAEFYHQSYEQAAIAGIEYVLDNLI